MSGGGGGSPAVDAAQLLAAPGRSKRPAKILIVLRGLPSSGKTTTVARLKQLEARRQPRRGAAILNSGVARRGRSVEVFNRAGVPRENDRPRWVYRRRTLRRHPGSTRSTTTSSTRTRCGARAPLSAGTPSAFNRAPPP